MTNFATNLEKMFAPKPSPPRDTNLSTRIRAIAANPTPENLAELPKLATMVARVERTLDEVVADAMEDDFLGRLAAGDA